MDQLHEKYSSLQSRLLELGSLAVAFSGGVDSTFLLQVAHDVLGDRTLAVTAASSATGMSLVPPVATTTRPLPVGVGSSPITPVLDRGS